MKNLSLSILFVLTYFSVSAQIVATLKLDKPVEGICHHDSIFALLPMMEGQTVAVSPVSKDELLSKLNELTFLKNNPKHKGKGNIFLIINCKGEVVQYEVNGKTKSEELNAQIIALMKSLGKWKPGVLYGKNVDSAVIYSFKIKKGIIYWD